MLHARVTVEGNNVKKRLISLSASVAAIAATLVAVLGLSALPAGAVAAADVPPIGADAGRFNLPITCQIALGGVNLIGIDLSVQVQGVAPATLAPGQQFYLTQGSGSMTFPDWIPTLAGLIGGGTADATLTELNIGSTAGNQIINVAQTPIYIPGIQIKSGQALTVGLPKTGTFEVGPYTAPKSGTDTLQFAGAKVSIVLHAGLGIDLPLSADCKPKGANALLTMEVGASSPNVQKYLGSSMNFPDVAIGQLVGTITSPYRCQFNGGNLDVGVAVNGLMPLSISRFDQFAISNASGALVVPTEQVNKLLDQGHSSISGSATALNLLTDNASPKSVNALSGGAIALPRTPLVRDHPVVLPLPATGTLKTPAMSPGWLTSATSMTVWLGSIAAQLSLDGGTASAATCATPSPRVILGQFPIT
ncbi:hypothetical protein SAMN05892883_1665 [Jatrophihabitans sp. GAS493]|uniref:hypothetical protein n=1 Tax=Jatrophihabitans sp. GAS493 TaxID=1907575 RepID=UPI000BB74EC2|nr:hypothetical protein [Jatrophihabitans sp. GAS493]SOD72256.1 hypothetical protein SAMN05892883_1665 [Jatrophihabitans sp. GAS493]